MTDIDGAVREEDQTEFVSRARKEVPRRSLFAAMPERGSIPESQSLLSFGQRSFSPHLSSRISVTSSAESR